MRIGLLTYFWEDDPGQFFQALATYQELQKQFSNATVELVDVRHWGECWRLGKRSLLAPRQAWEKYRQHQAYEQSRSLFQISQESCYTADRSVAAQFLQRQNYDVLVIGSDVTLKPLPCYMDKDQLPIYWLPPEIPGIHVMLASSADTLRSEQLTVRQMQQAQAALQNFSFITVRDSMTYDLINFLSDTKKKHFCCVPDSTFAYSLNSISTDAPPLKYLASTSRPLCAVHLPSTTFTNRLVELLSLDFDLVTIRGTRWPQSRRHWDHMPPMLWSTMFANFSCVVTVSLHECIFSMKNGVPPFAVDIKPDRVDIQSGRSKTRCLMADMNLLHHHFSPHLGNTPEEIYAGIKKGVENFDSNAMMRRVELQGLHYQKAVQDLRLYLGAGSCD